MGSIPSLCGKIDLEKGGGPKKVGSPWDLNPFLPGQRMLRTLAVRLYVPLSIPTH